MEKDCLFQYATRHKIIEDTDLITQEEAEKMWEKYQKDIKENWDSFNSPQMCIWMNADSNIDYSKVLKEIDYRDCELENGTFYKITKQEIK